MNGKNSQTSAGSNSQTGAGPNKAGQVLQALLSGNQQNNMPQQMLQSQQYLKMLQDMMAGGQGLQGMTLADTAGLTPAHMNQAMQTMLGQQQINRQAMADAIEAQYKAGLLSTYGQQSRDRRLNMALDYDIGLRRLSAAERTEFIKNFEYQKKKGGYRDINKYYEWWVKQRKTAPTPKTPTPLSTASALNSIRYQYGKESPSGQFFIKPELQDAHNYAIKRFHSYLSANPNDTLSARNMAIRDTKGLQLKCEQMADKLKRLGRANEIPAMTKYFWSTR